MAQPTASNNQQSMSEMGMQLAGQGQHWADPSTAGIQGAMPVAMPMMGFGVVPAAAPMGPVITAAAAPVTGLGIESAAGPLMRYETERRMESQVMPPPNPHNRTLARH